MGGDMKLAAIAILLSGIAASAWADNVVWFGNRHEDGASLVYGIPDSGYGRIVLSCEVGNDDLSFVYEHEPADARNGVKLDVILSAGDQEVSIPTTGTRLEIDDTFILEGRTKLDDRLVDLLTSPGTLTVTVEDGIADYPLDGAAEASRHLVEVCSPHA